MRLVILAALALLLPQAALAACVPPEIPYAEEAIGGRPVMRFIPKNPRGVVYLFHGTGGSENYASRRETRCAIAPLLAKGYGFVASQSGRAPPVRWLMDPAASPDVDHMLAIHRELVRRGEITAATPVFTLGMSNGGGFATVFGLAARAAGLPVTAIADYMGPLAPAALALVPRPADLPPLFVVVAEKDGLVEARRVAETAERLKAEGATVELHVARPRPFTASDLVGVDGMAPAAAEAAVAALKAAGIIDAGGMQAALLDRPVLDRQAQADLAAMAPPGTGGREGQGALLIAFAGHQMRSDYADENARFFEAALKAR